MAVPRLLQLECGRKVSLCALCSIDFNALLSVSGAAYRDADVWPDAMGIGMDGRPPAREGVSRPRLLSVPLIYDGGGAEMMRPWAFQGPPRLGRAGLPSREVRTIKNGTGVSLSTMPSPTAKETKDTYGSPIATPECISPLPDRIVRSRSLCLPSCKPPAASTNGDSGTYMPYFKSGIRMSQNHDLMPMWDHPPGPSQQPAGSTPCRASSPVRMTTKLL